MAAAILAILVLGAGAAGFWFWQKGQGPKPVVEKALVALKAKDWKTLYDVEIPAAQKQSVSQEQFSQAMDKMFSTLTVKEYKINDPTIEGDTAKASVTVTMNQTGETKTSSITLGQDIDLKRTDGKWAITKATAPAPVGGGGMSAPSGAR